MQNKTLHYTGIENTFPYFTRAFSSTVHGLPSSKLMSLGVGAVTLRNVIMGYSGNKTITKEFGFFDERLPDVNVSTLNFFVVDPYLVFKLNRDVVQKDVNELFTKLCSERIYEANERSEGEFSRLIEHGGSWSDWEIATSYSEMIQTRKGLRPNICRKDIEAARKTILNCLVQLYKDNSIHSFVGEYVNCGLKWASTTDKKTLKSLSMLKADTQEYDKTFHDLARARDVGAEMRSIKRRLHES